MIKILSFLIGLLFSFGVFADFLPQTDDVPLMDGITINAPDDFSFDTPAGQILVFEGTTQLSVKSIQSFYAKTLTALGWTQKEKDSYVRGSDTLKLSFPSPKKVRFDITLSSANH